MNTETDFIEAGNKAFQMGFIDKAINEYESAIQLNEDSWMAYKGVGNCYEKKRKHEDAIVAFSKAIEITSTEAILLYCRARIFYAEKRYDEMIDDLDKAIELKPDYWSAYFARAFYYQSTKEHEKALFNYDSILEISTGDSNIFNNRAISLGSLGYFAESVANFKQSIFLDPRFPDAFKNLGFLYVDHGKPNKAIMIFDEYLKLMPEDEKILELRNQQIEKIENDPSLAKEKNVNPHTNLYEALRTPQFVEYLEVFNIFDDGLPETIKSLTNLKSITFFDSSFSKEEKKKIESLLPDECSIKFTVSKN